ncbi:GGDEF domain-containing protein [Rhabdothermincola salaria]|uniref:GGDEF domain-containing protein n=1 Tax=Rhabdothermincola salaria TaxID=2903142 RepID=UPI001E2C9BFF|nr:GGDEF domain-containing protein [Rhabdothermincola salaria]MCD9625346.1 diguanylate cyclase [Rhabdothermincola salaria]
MPRPRLLHLGPPLAVIVVLLGLLVWAVATDHLVTAVWATFGVSAALVWFVLGGLRDRRHMTAELQGRDTQLLTVLDGLPIAVMLRDEKGHLLHANPGTERFLERLGLTVDHIAESPVAMLDHIDVIREDGRPWRPADLPVVSAIRDGVSTDAVLGYALPEGGWAWYSARAEPLPLGDGTLGTVLTLDDVTERRALEQELRDAALTDPLTGLANRRALSERLAEAQKRQARHGGVIGLIYLDLDGFKAVNDTWGHDVGDRVLISVGERLRRGTRAIDLPCRIGGDEFVVLCDPLEDPADLADLVRRLRELPPLMVPGSRADALTVSIGSVVVERGEGLDTALRRADRSMFQAKRGTPPGPAAEAG